MCLLCMRWRLGLSYLTTVTLNYVPKPLRKFILGTLKLWGSARDIVLTMVS